MTEKVQRLLHTLERRVGRRRRPPPTDVLSQMMEVVVIHMAGERAAKVVLREFRENFVDWNEVRVARRMEITRATNGIAEGSAVGERIQSLLSAIYTDRGNMNLDALVGRSTVEIRQFLQSLEPLGKELVPVVMLQAMQQSIMPIGDRILRLHKRFNIVPGSTTQGQLRRYIESIFEGEEIYRYYHAVRRLAGRVCLGENPNCKQCTVEGHCRVVAETGRKK